MFWVKIEEGSVQLPVRFAVCNSTLNTFFFWVRGKWLVNFGGRGEKVIKKINFGGRGEKVAVKIQFSRFGGLGKRGVCSY